MENKGPGVHVIKHVKEMLHYSQTSNIQQIIEIKKCLVFKRSELSKNYPF